MSDLFVLAVIGPGLLVCAFLALRLVAKLYGSASQSEAIAKIQRRKAIMYNGAIIIGTFVGGLCIVFRAESSGASSFEIKHIFDGIFWNLNRIMIYFAGGVIVLVCLACTYFFGWMTISAVATTSKESVVPPNLRHSFRWLVPWTYAISMGFAALVFCFIAGFIVHQMVVGGFPFIPFSTKIQL